MIVLGDRDSLHNKELPYKHKQPSGVFGLVLSHAIYCSSLSDLQLFNA